MMLMSACALMASVALAEGFDSNSLLYAHLGKTEPIVFKQITEHGEQKIKEVNTPLGSVWKLFVHAYAIDRALPMPAYQCRGGEWAKEELFCCNPGESIGSEAALAQSCGLFFEPARLNINAQDWQQYWRKKAPQVSWLADLSQLKPAQTVSVSSLLQALASVEGSARDKTEMALLGVVLNGRGQSALPQLGGRYRVKTYTWDHPQHPDTVVGGAAGWMSDGSAVWFGAVGSSVTVLQSYASQLAQQAELLAGDDNSGRCVDVAMFARYPIKRILHSPQGNEVLPGATQTLNGAYQIEFANGHKLKFKTQGEMQLSWQSKTNPMLSLRVNENEYIARVIDREANASQREAARALGIVARTYLLQNAVQHSECLAISDSSRTQRVSPNQASRAAREVAGFTSGLVLQGVDAQYRLNDNAPNIFSWQRAVKLEQAGMSYDDILHQEFAQGALASTNGASECLPMPEAEKWLTQQSRVWVQTLQAEPGFAQTQPKVCQLNFGKPYSDLAHHRIYVRGLHSLNNRLTLAHEYLHLAFAAYPSGQDENYIEQWARRLIEGNFK
jgi:uncharacterized protein YfaQ (DUF2300 family)